MKKFLFFLLITISFALHGQQINSNSRLQEVTVYRSMAREIRTSTAAVQSGYIDVIIPGISIQMLDPSLQVSVKGEATLLSATVRTNYFASSDPPLNQKKADQLRDSLRILELEMRWIAEEKGIHSGEMNLINELLKPASDKDVAAATDLTAKADFYRARTREIKRGLFDLTLREESIQNRRNAMQSQLNEMGARKSQPEKEIVLSFYCEKDESVQLHCGYLVQNAGWIPAYDIHVENTSKPVNLSYKAKIYQNTGYDWKDVEMTVSSTNPNLENNRPLMSARFIDYVQYAVSSESNFENNNFMQMDRSFNEAYTTPILSLPTAIAEIDPMEKEIQLEFEVAIKQTIPSDGKEHICKLKSFDVPATYRYHAVPKLDPAAFLLARITDYAQYNLLIGEANVFYGDTYVGAVQINPHIVSDTLLISLGRDERIIVKRIRIEDKVSKKKFGDMVKDTYAYQTTIRNNKNVPIEIEVLDQIPLSRRKEIKVELEDKCGAEYNEAFGKLLWRFTVKPNDSQKINLEYSVEYPEGKSVEEL
ncbi:MAG: DUF4139 domain-containing protein [Flavobacteriales bacterium]